MNNSLALLIECCQISPDISKLEHLAGEITDWDALIKTATHHGILPLAHQALRDITSVPAQIKVSLKTINFEISQHNMFMSAELLKLTSLFNANNIEVLAIKGPALAAIAYGDITQRYFSDIDILVKRKDFREIADILILLGYEPRFPIETFIGEKVMFEMNNDCPFYHTARGMTIEIHWDFFQKLALPTDQFFPWESTQTIMLGAHPCLTLSHETHLLYHALHGSKHVWERFEWIVDIDRFIRAIPSLDWEKIVSMARNMGALKMFLLGIVLSKHYFQTPLPENVQTLCRNARLDDCIAYVDGELKAQRSTPEESLPKLIKVIGLRDSFYYKTVTLLEFIFRPGINERRAVVLSDSLFWLYWPLRPFGMFWRFVVCRLLKLC
jgi:hypothetical protein